MGIEARIDGINARHHDAAVGRCPVVSEGERARA
jgi:hypothetical protein